MKEYVLFHDTRGRDDRYWYGSYGEDELWSTWVYSLKEAVEAPMVKVNIHIVNTINVDMYIHENREIDLLYRSTVPLAIDTHPEYFI